MLSVFFRFPLLKLGLIFVILNSQITGTVGQVNEMQNFDLAHQDSSSNSNASSENNLEVRTRVRNAPGLSYGMLCKLKMTEPHKYDDTQPKNTTTIIEQSHRTCKISQGLECIPFLQLRRKNESEASNSGHCRCLQALSLRAIYLTPKRHRAIFKPGCYIPAGFASSSTCGHIVPLPFGTTQTLSNLTKIGDHNVTLKWISHTSIGDTRKMCVPNSECKSSSKYSGKRCVCHRWAVWNFEDGTCSSPREIVLEKNRSNLAGLSPIAAFVPVLYSLHCCLGLN